MTSDGAALFRAIREHPREDAPRLVYADWLEENGRPERGEFIRLQCEGSVQCPAYPGTARRTRASELLRTFRDDWDAELPSLHGLEWGDIYFRGFVDTVRLFEVRYMSALLERAFATAPLRFLFVAEIGRGQLGELLAFPLLGRLTKLYLPGTFGEAEARLVIAAQGRFPNTEIA
ncbi:MAG: TIGR02996 domain-containing protein [Planctomycetes bacterium]|nr:TIGR02996 domain-containing protein [Planctomycetota bacterium]